MQEVIMGHLIAITGTDCSGKQTQTEKLLKALTEKGYRVSYLSFPDYEQSTGKILSGPCLGKVGESYFEENFSNVDPKVASLYYAADRRYTLPRIMKALDEFDFVICDRYVESNMAHQGGKIKDEKDRLEFYKWEEHLEYELLELPRPELTVFLFMPYEKVIELLNQRTEKKDDVEKDEVYLKNSEATYLELADLYHYETVPCAEENCIRSIDDIAQSVLDITLKKFEEEKQKRRS